MPGNSIKHRIKKYGYQALNVAAFMAIWIVEFDIKDDTNLDILFLLPWTALILAFMYRRKTY